MVQTFCKTLTQTITFSTSGRATRFDLVTTLILMYSVFVVLYDALNFMIPENTVFHIGVTVLYILLYRNILIKRYQDVSVHTLKKTNHFSMQLLGIFSVLLTVYFIGRISMYFLECIRTGEFMSLAQSFILGSVMVGLLAGCFYSLQCLKAKNENLMVRNAALSNALGLGLFLFSSFIFLGEVMTYVSTANWSGIEFIINDILGLVVSGLLLFSLTIFFSSVLVAMFAPSHPEANLYGDQPVTRSIVDYAQLVIVIIILIILIFY